MMTAEPSTDIPVLRSVIVKASQEHAFRVFTEGFDTWWPRQHHIGSSPMKRAIIEGFVGGRCYSEQEDGTDCPWGSVFLWDPPHRFAFYWKINPQWQFEPDPAKASEVEVRFLSLGDGTTKVELEHRYFARHGEGGDRIRTGVEGPMGWADLLRMYGERAEQTA
jgi:hypothetical protein